ncbi:MAG TPA: helix-turn-helix domain-containing protein [Ktedonobacteraceae bacterium]|nr:helix-turn-helix domain-containing protein [Ktedonobacteraceae bacterium]
MPTVAEQEQLLTVYQVADILQQHPNTVRDLIKAGELPASRIGKREYRIARSDLQTFLDRRRTSRKDDQERD